MNLPPEQRHEYRRHGYGMVVTWYTWFIMLNYAVLGGMAANPGQITRSVAWILTVLFTTHGLAGLFVMFYIHQYYSAEFKDAVDLAERRVARMYIVGIYGMTVTFISLVAVWLAVPFFWDVV